MIDVGTPSAEVGSAETEGPTGGGGTIVGTTPADSEATGPVPSVDAALRLAAGVSPTGVGEAVPYGLDLHTTASTTIAASQSD